MNTRSTTHLLWVGRWVEAKWSTKHQGWTFKNGADVRDYLLS
jgi:hypothetical protein